MSAPGLDVPEQYIVTFRRPGGGKYRLCLVAFDVYELAEAARAEERAHGSRFIAAELLE